MALKCQVLLEAIEPHLKAHGADLVKRTGFVYHFEITQGGKEVVSFTIDLKNGTGSFAKGKQGKSDCVFIMDDADVVAVAAGTLNPQIAFMQGKMKIKGNMAAAMKFTPDLLPKVGVPKL